MVKTESVKAPALGFWLFFSSYHFSSVSNLFSLQVENHGFFHLCDFLLSLFLVAPAVFALFHTAPASRDPGLGPCLARGQRGMRGKRNVCSPASISLVSK